MILVDDKSFAEAESHFADAQLYLKNYVMKEKKVDVITTTKYNDHTMKKVEVFVEKVAIKKPLSTSIKVNITSLKN